MKKRLYFFTGYFVFWYVYFVIGRIAFIIAHHSLAQNLSFADYFRIFGHGFKLDVSAATYLIFFPALLLLLGFVIPGRFFGKIMKIYTGLLLFLISAIVIIDIYLYGIWGFRIDSTPLLYLDHPAEVLASVTFWQVSGLLLLVLILSAVFYVAYHYLLHKPFTNFKKEWVPSLIFVLIIPLLIIPLRGGIGLAPVSVSTAYFHESRFANHSAVNPLWNLMYTLSENKNVSNAHHFMDSKQAEVLFRGLYPEPGTSRKILHANRPNILIIVMESFTSKVIGALGGMQEVTPQLNRLVHEGILFDHFYASGDRTEKAMAAIIAAYPSLPTTNIIKYTNKSEKLDFITKALKTLNYTSTYYYGGSIDFANYRSFLVNAGFDQIVSKEDFNPATYNSKWGAWDHVVLDRVLEDIKKNKEPFFRVVFTLTSHEPFEIPGKPVFPGSDVMTAFLNSVHYTDQCIGDFVEKLKKEKCWDNTLVVLVADHGHTRPGNTANNDRLKFQIPMIWLGGALSVKDTIVRGYGSQTDIASTLFGQMDYKPDRKFLFSRNIFDTKSASFAFYSFNDGFGFLSDSCYMVYDNPAGKYVVEEGKNAKSCEQTGKAYLQILSEDFIRK